VNSCFTAGTTHACAGGQPGSVVEFRRKVTSASFTPDVAFRSFAHGLACRGLKQERDQEKMSKFKDVYAYLSFLWSN